MKRFIIPGALVLIGLHPSTQEKITAHEPDDCTARQAFAECPMKPDLQCSAQDITVRVSPSCLGERRLRCKLTEYMY